jgi:hypothetical protein
MDTEHDAPPRAFAGRWLLGLVLATVLAGLLTAPFTDSVMPYVRDPAIGALLPEAGHRHRQRAEGWGDSTFGRFGVSAHPDVTALTGPTVAVWGDSYVEGLQVDDDEKVGAQVSARCPSVTGVGIGQSGRAAADVVFLLPRYEKHFSPAVHYVVLPHLSDVLPDGSRFLDAPPRLVEVPFTAGSLGLRPVIEQFRLQLVWRAARTAANGADGDRVLRLVPGPVPVDPARLGGSKYDRPVTLPADATLDHLLSALAGATAKPVVLVYTPAVPRIRANAIETVDPDAAAARHVATLAERHGIGFLGLGERFVSTFRAEGSFPRGFHNGVPGGGHWNALGHRLVAAAICDDLAARGLVPASGAR